MKAKKNKVDTLATQTLELAALVLIGLILAYSVVGMI